MRRSASQLPYRETGGATGREARLALKGDWDALRTTIERLYINEDRALKDVKDIMAREHGFYATDKMYKSRLKKWKLEKNLRKDEVLAMMRVKMRRDRTGRTAEFWRNGKQVTPEMLDNYLRFNKGVVAEIRKHVLVDLASSDPIEALLPRHITVLSPMAPLEVDQQLHTTEGMIINIRNYVDSALSSGTWKQVSRKNGNWYSVRGGALHAPLILRSYVWVALRMVKDKHKHRASYLNLAFSAIRPTIRTENAGLVIEMTMLLFDMETAQGLPEMARIFIDYVARISQQVLGEQHPVTNWFKALAVLKKEKVETYEVLVRSFSDLVRQRAGRHNLNVTHCMIHYGKIGLALFPGFQERELADLNAEIEGMKGDECQREILLGLLRYRYVRLMNLGRNEEALAAIHEVVTTTGVQEMVLAQEALGNVYAALNKPEESRAAFFNHLHWRKPGDNGMQPVKQSPGEPNIFRIRQYYRTADACRKWGYTDIADKLVGLRDSMIEAWMGKFDIEEIFQETDPRTRRF